MTRAIIVGRNGQDGRILFDQLQREGAAIVGIARDLTRGEPCNSVDILDQRAVGELVRNWQPTHVYYLAAFHHSSEELPNGDDAALLARSLEVHVLGLTNFLESIKQFAPRARLFNAASSLVYGDVRESPQTEATPFAPRCIYGITKVAGVECCRLYRRSHCLFAASGILYNHESIYRRHNFLSKKIVRAALNIRDGKQQKLVLGDLSARVDWGYAPDFVRAIRQILALELPDDYIVATGEAHTVQEFVQNVFELLGLNWEEYVEEDPNLLTRTRTLRIGDASKLREHTGWAPSVSFREMIQLLLNDIDGRH
jgi:GDPmannose 4,6-dehydratase